MTEDRNLAEWRREFPILDTCVYLVSHSLGAMPRRTFDNLTEFGNTWARRGVRAWAEGWWDLGVEVGNLLAPILGVPPGSISMHQNVTVAQAVIASCHRFDGPRRKIVMSDMEFPSNMYLYEGFRHYGAHVEYVVSNDPVRVPTDQLVDAIDERTLLVVVSQVFFKSASILDAAAVVDQAHRVGARVVLDVYQAAGTIPLRLEQLGVDFAVGGSVKWLCGGPGAGYLYVRPDLAGLLEPGVTGWAAHALPFEFEPGPVRYDSSSRRFGTGTPNVPALYSARAGYEIVAQVGVEAIRAQSVQLTRRLIELADERGYRVHTPRVDRERGGTVTLDVPNSRAVADRLIRRDVVIDYRPGAGIRMAPHFYNTAAEIDQAMEILDEIVAQTRSTMGHCQPADGHD